jgi:hypothetical protein
MPFCPHCGTQATDDARFCTACSAPITPDGLAAEARRQRKQLRVAVVAVSLALAVTLGVLLDRVLSANAVGSFISGATAAPQQPQQQSPQQPPPASDSAPSDTANNTPTGGIDPEAVQRALAQLTQAQRSGQGNPPAQQLPAPSVPAGSDRYPGSQPVTVDTSSIPDIGIPVSSEVYTTSDPVATVVSYYRKRYPDARVTEINGQQIIAVDRPGAIKVIAVGSNGQETRIAIVQPGS